MTREQQELDAGLREWVYAYITARRAGALRAAKSIRDNIRERCTELGLDETVVFNVFGDPDEDHGMNERDLVEEDRINHLEGVYGEDNS